VHTTFLLNGEWREIEMKVIDIQASKAVGISKDFISLLKTSIKWIYVKRRYIPYRLKELRELMGFLILPHSSRTLLE